MRFDDIMRKYGREADGAPIRNDIMRDYSNIKENAPRESQQTAPEQQTTQQTVKKPAQQTVQQPAQTRQTGGFEAWKNRRADRESYDSRVRSGYQNRAGSLTSSFTPYSDTMTPQDFVKWRTSIRDPQRVQADVDALEKQANELNKQIRNTRYSGLVSVGNVSRIDPQKGIRDLNDELARIRQQQDVLKEEKYWGEYFGWEQYRYNPDFAKLSKYVSEPTGKQATAAEKALGYGSDGKYKDNLYEWINGNEEAGAALRQSAANAYGDDPLGRLFAQGSENEARAAQMDPEDIQLFNYIYHTQGGDAAREYYDWLSNNKLNAKMRQDDLDYIAEQMEQHPVSGRIIGSAASVAVKPLSILSGAAQVGDFVGNGLLTKTGMEYEAPYNKFSDIPDSVRAEVSKNWGWAGKALYDTGMSMADFLYNSAMTGGLMGVKNEALEQASLIIMGAEATPSAVLDAKRRGLNDRQAMSLGAIAGFAEYITEKVSLETLLDKIDNDGWKWYLAKNVLAEGSEELASNWINRIADAVISRDKSEWMQAVQQGMNEGKTKQQAWNDAFKDVLIEDALSFGGGGLSGGIMAGGRIGIDWAGNKIAQTNVGGYAFGRSLSPEQQQALVETALESAPDSTLNRYAQRMQAKLGNGEQLTPNESGRLYSLLSRAMSEEENAPAPAQPYDFTIEEIPDNEIPSSPSGEIADETARALFEAAAGMDEDENALMETQAEGGATELFGNSEQLNEPVEQQEAPVNEYQPEPEPVQQPEEARTPVETLPPELIQAAQEMYNPEPERPAAVQEPVYEEPTPMQTQSTAEPVVEQETPVQQAQQEEASASINSYDSLRDRLSSGYNLRENVGNIEFRLGLTGGNGDVHRFTLNVRRTGGDVLGGMVTSSRDNIYSGAFETREEAIDTALNIARNLRLFDDQQQESRDAKPAAKSPAKPLQPVENGGKVETENPKAEAAKPAEKPAATKAPAEQADNDTPQRTLSDYVMDLLNRGESFDGAALFRLADKAFSGTMANGDYTVKDAYDGMELAVNRYLMNSDFIKDANGDVETAKDTISGLQDFLQRLPTQNKRTEEQVQYQQFSTPPTIAYIAAWTANINEDDVVVEPSAGIGGLALFPKAWGAEVYGNEYSARRLKFLNELGLDGTFNLDARQLDNLLPDSIKPSVILMNPPFSSSSGNTTKNKTSNATRHIEQALDRLRPNGRLIAILGRGMSEDAASFKNWWKEIKSEYTVRANVQIDGRNYTKYGTSFDIQLAVIDKVGPQTGTTLTGTVTDLMELPAMLEGIRNERAVLEESVRNDGDGSKRSGHEPRNVVEHGGRDGASGEAAPVLGTAQQNGAVNVHGSDGRNGGTVRGSESRNGNGSRNGSTSESGARSGQPTGGTVSVTEKADKPKKLKLEKPVNQPNAEIAKNVDSVFSTYSPKKVQIKGAKAHPSKLVESSAMAAVDPPDVTYSPIIDQKIIDEGRLSDAQLENIVYAGQAHEQLLPDGRRKGYFIGDGTGVGKGAQIAGIILDNMNHGRNKAVWITKNFDLLPDAKRDVEWVGMDPKKVISQKKLKAGAPIKETDGILFTGYGTLSSKWGKNGNTSPRLDDIVNWLGKDFDGVIAFDESHKMAGAIDRGKGLSKKKASNIGLAGLELQKRLPNARIVYASATGATEVANYAYLQRLGLWGKGTAFKDINEFVGKVSDGGLAAMELVARDMKSMGLYMSRSISYDDVEYSRLEAPLDGYQREIYNTMSDAWTTVLQNIDDAVEVTGGGRLQKQQALNQFYSNSQNFFNQVITSMKTPAMIQQIRQDLDDGKSVVIQLTNTNEAALKRALEDLPENGDDLEDLDMTPTEILINYLEKSFPIQEMEEMEDENGHIFLSPVVDANGEPVISKKALRMRDELIARVQQMKVPDGPLELLFNAFGPDMIAEATGRSQGVVTVTGENGAPKRVIQKRGANASDIDAQAFQDGKKRILVFSEAGGTGKSYHADRRAKNQQQRVHYLLQAGWKGDVTVQGLGRAHRTNEASAPIIRLVSSDVPGEKRFLSTIARRLDQLGALTKGQRDASGGVFSAADNLENEVASDALAKYYESIPEDVLHKLGLYEKLYDEYGRYKGKNNPVTRDVSKFLNRLLMLPLDMQEEVFDGYTEQLEKTTTAAEEAGLLDKGLQNYKADRIEVIDEKTIRKDKTGADTKYLQLKVFNKPTIVKYGDLQNSRFEGLYRLEGGSVRAVYTLPTKTNEFGKVIERFKLASPIVGVTSEYQKDTFEAKCKEIPRAEWRSAWEAEIKKAPEFTEQTKHMITGTILPIWGKLPQGTKKVERVVTSDGSQYLGMIVSPRDIDYTLQSLGASRTMEKYTSAQISSHVLDGNKVVTFRDDGIRLKRSRVSGEWRIELVGMNANKYRWHFPGIQMEQISSQWRYFIPTGALGTNIINAIMSINPVVAVNDSKGGISYDAVAEEAIPASKNNIDEEYFEYLRTGNVAEAERMVQEAASKYLSSFLLPDDTDEEGFKYHRGPAPTKTMKRYAVFNVTPGGFKAAYAGNKSGTPVGVWLDAQNLKSYTSDLTQFRDGTFAAYIPGDTGAAFNTKFSPELMEKMVSEDGLKRGQRWLLERGGKHSSDVPNFSQMNLKQDENGNKVKSAKDGALPNNKLIFEIEYGFSDDGDITDYVKENGRIDSGGKNQGLARIQPNQYYSFKTNPNAVGEWGIGGTFRIVRLVPYSEVVERTAQFKDEQVRLANKAFNAGEISNEDRKARIKGANAIQVQKWVGGYHPENYNLTVESVDKMFKRGQKMKLMDTVTYDDNGMVIPLSKRFNIKSDDIRYDSSSGVSAAKFSPHDPSRWKAERNEGAESKPVRSVSEILAGLEHDFGVNITEGHMRNPKRVRGFYNPENNGVRIREAGNLPTAVHELGHALDYKYSIVKNLPETIKKEIVDNLGDHANGYKKSQLAREGVAEFVRKYMQNKDSAIKDYPLFSDHFLRILTAEDYARIDQYADDINNLYANGRAGRNTAIRMKENAMPRTGTLFERAAEFRDKFVFEWRDTNVGIKRFSEKAGDDTAYILATNSAYSDAVGSRMISGGDLVDPDGKYVGAGLARALSTIDLNVEIPRSLKLRYGLNIPIDKLPGSEYADFGEYLVCKHGPERLREGMRVFNDDVMDTAAWMNGRAEELEAMYPQFKEAAEALYEFQTNFLITWGVKTGLVSKESAAQWIARWKYYVPLNRVVENGSSGGAKKGYVNQVIGIHKAKGSGLDIIHPVDNIMYNILNMVNAATRNRVASEISNLVEKKHMPASIMEKIPAPLAATKVRMEGAKNYLGEEIASSNLEKEDMEEMLGIVMRMDDFMLQFDAKRRGYGRDVTVLKNGKPEFWRINDENLFRSMASLTQTKMGAALDAYATVNRFITGNITGNNVVWSLFSNAPRDLGTLLAYSPNHNVLTMLRDIGSTYANAMKNETAQSPLFREYLAIGGGKASYYSADREAAMKARKELARAQKKFSISPNPMDWLSFVSDTVEMGPRFATYKYLREQGVDSQHAFYAAMDVTVNFRKGGRTARELNKLIPFFNASVQGIDKFERWVSAADITSKEQRGLVAAGRFTAWMTVNAILGALIYGLNNSSPEKKKDYELLSNYTKNSFWNIPMGDGKFFAIPKPRELAIPSSIVSSAMEYIVGGNKHAFDQTYEYIADNVLPNAASDIAQKDIAGAIGSLGIVGTGAYMMANRDFLGRPIVSTAYMNLEKRDQYNGRTSKAAKIIGDALNESPMMLDFLFQNTLGGFWKYQRALLPVDPKERDISLGVKNTYVKDPLYSNDIVNWLYDHADETAKSHKSHVDDLDAAISAKKDDNMTTFYSRYNKLAKGEAEDRSVKLAVLDMIADYRSAVESGEQTRIDKIINEIVTKTNSGTELLPSAMQPYVKDADGNKHNLTSAQYYEFQTLYNGLYYSYVEQTVSAGDDLSKRAAVLREAKQQALNDASAKILKQVGIFEASKYGDVSTAAIIEFNAEKKLDDGGFKNDDATAILEGMDLDDESKAILWQVGTGSKSSKNNPWKNALPDWLLETLNS